MTVYVATTFVIYYAPWNINRKKTSHTTAVRDTMCSLSYQLMFTVYWKSGADQVGLDRTSKTMLNIGA